MDDPAPVTRRDCQDGWASTLVTRRWFLRPGVAAITGAVASSACGAPLLAERSTGPEPVNASGEVVLVRLGGSVLAERGDYRVFLPPGYGLDGASRYPAVYLLHGAGDDDTQWLQIGVTGVADQMIRSGQLLPLILVLLDAGPSYGPGPGGASFEDYLADELVPDVDSRFATTSAREGRAIGGISLGGARALEAAAAVPQLFSAVGGHSPVVRNAEVQASELASAGWQIYLDVGERDPLRPGVQSLVDALARRDVPHTVRVQPGRHNRVYWTAHLIDYLSFYSAALTIDRTADPRCSRPPAS